MDKSAVRREVSTWLKDTMLEEGESCVVFPERNHLTIRIINRDGLYRDERPRNPLALPLKSGRGVQYSKCPNCGKKGMRDAHYTMKPLEMVMSLFKYGGSICKYCGYAKYLEPKDGKVETKQTIVPTLHGTEYWLKKQKEENKRKEEKNHV